MAKHFIAKDCMPFYSKEVEQAANAVGFGQKADELVKLNDADFFIPIDNRYNNDADSKIAYSPFETRPFTFTDGTSARVWQAGRYIGEAVINNTKITIKPRFGENCLLAMLHDVCHFRYAPSDNKQRNGNDWNEIVKLIIRYLWIQKFVAADKYGLPRITSKHQQQGIQIRGHLNVRKTIWPYITKGQVVSEYREKEIDDAICKIVYKAFSILAKGGISKSIIPPQIQNSLDSLYTCYHGQECAVSEDEYQKIRYKRIFQSWKPLTDFSWQIVKQHTFSMTYTEDLKGNSLFLDMAEIWESFLRKTLGDVLAREEYGGWQVIPQSDCETHVYNEQFYKRKLIPDLLFYRVVNGKNQYIVLDAKYKRMRGWKDDVDRTDFFQIHSYIQYYSSLDNSEVVLGGLLYPLESPTRDKQNWFSETLFGLSLGRTQFIVDGICLNDLPNNIGETEVTAALLYQRIDNMVKNWQL